MTAAPPTLVQASLGLPGGAPVTSQHSVSRPWSPAYHAYHTQHSVHLISVESLFLSLVWYMIPLTPFHPHSPSAASKDYSFYFFPNVQTPP